MSVQRDIDDELRFHLEARVEELVAQGVKRDAARAQALSEFGDVNETRANLAAIDTRVARRRTRIEWFEALFQDLKYAARSLLRSPAVSLTIIVTLALGIGANAAMFSLLDAIYFRPPAGVVDPGALRRVWVEREFRDGRQFWSGLDYATYVAIGRIVNGQATVATYRAPGKRAIGRGENAPTIKLSPTDGNYFRFLGVTAARGRLYDTTEATPGSSQPVIVISDALWRRQFDADENIVGTPLVLGTQRFTIIGVTPPGFTGVDLDAAEAWAPIEATLSARAVSNHWWTDSNVNGFQMLLRLAPSAAEGQMLAQLTTLMRSPEVGWRGDSLSAVRFGAVNAARGPAKASGELQVATRLAGVAIIVLLIACANVVNLLLARAATREREIAVRLALGISRARLMRLLLAESVVLALAAGAAALLAAQWGTVAMRALLLPDVVWGEPVLHSRLLAFALVVTLGVGMLIGLAPALRASAPSLTAGLRAGTRGRSTHRSRLRTALVVAQAALSVTLLVGAVLFIRSLENVTAHNVGFSVRELAFGQVHYDTRDSVRDALHASRMRALEPRLRRLPGVEQVAFASEYPKSSISFEQYFPDADTARHKPPPPIISAVSANYFATAGDRIVAGRTLTEGLGPNAPATVVINQALADALWPNENPLGRCIRFTLPTNPCATIVGIAETAMLSSLDEAPVPHLYVSIDQPPFVMGTYAVIRTRPERMSAVSAELRDALREAFPGSIPEVAVMSQVMASEYRPWTLGSTLFSLFGVLALIVAAVGVYSAVSYAVAQRTHEFGVRMALGARAGDVLGQVLREEARTVGLGVLAGIALTIAAGRLVNSLLYGVSATDPLSLALVALLLMVIALGAALQPAWRASRADPVTALRSD